MIVEGSLPSLEDNCLSINFSSSKNKKGVELMKEGFFLQYCIMVTYINDSLELCMCVCVFIMKNKVIFY
jgi:hypothetical protein